MDVGNVEFVKLKRQIETKNKGKIISKRPLDVGGIEGKKYSVEIQMRKHNIPQFSKEYPPENKQRALDTVETYGILREKGYPVPATTRYYEENGNSYVLMTDETEGGECRLWGWGDLQSEAKLTELREMKLNDEKVNKLKTLARDLIEKANRDRILLHTSLIHIKQRKSDGKLSLILLDVAKSNLDYHLDHDDEEIVRKNTRYLQNFINNIFAYR
jgi:hypothetical protein